MIRRFLVAAALIVFIAPAARADCTPLANGVVPYDLHDPAGAVTVVTQATTTATAVVQGALAYDTTANLLKVCDGTNWQSLSPITAAGSTGQIQFNNAGSLGADSGLFWDNANKRLGIGTANPLSSIAVAGAIRGQAVAASGDVLFVGDDSILRDINIANTLGIVGNQNGTQAHIKLGTSGPIISGVSGNVGIGTTTPTSLLHLSAPQASVGLALTDTTNNHTLTITKANAANEWLFSNTMRMSTIATNLILRQNSFITIQAPLDAGTAGLRVVSTQGNGNASTPQVLIVPTATQVSPTFQIKTGSGNAALHVETAGNVGIGTTTPAERLVVDNAFAMHNGGHQVIFINQNSSATDPLPSAYSGEIRFKPDVGILSFGVSSSANSVLSGSGTSTSNILNIVTGGNIGIGTATPAATLDVNGYAKLAKNTSAPVACSITTEGSLAYTGGTTKYLCFCDGSTWQQVHSPSTACTW